MSTNDDLFLTVVVPALNEEENIVASVEAMLRDLDRCRIKAEVIVANDGSTDKTPDLVRGLMKKDSRIRLLEHKIPQGIGASFWDGVDLARGNAVVFLPGDNENSPYETFRYVKLLEDVDIIVPFVFNKGVRPRSRVFLSALYCFIVSLTFLAKFHYTNGTVIYRTSLLRGLRRRSTGFFYQTDMLIRLTKKGYLFAEVPYKLLKREKGASKAITLKTFIILIGDYFKLIWDACVRHELWPVKQFCQDSVTAKRHAGKI